MRRLAALGASLALTAFCAVLPVHARATAPPGCPSGHPAVTNLHYAIFHASGSSNVNHLQGNFQLGDQINVLFNVPQLPAGCAQVTLTIASYNATKPQGQPRGQFQLYDSQSQGFIAGGGYEMTVHVIPPPPGSAAKIIALVEFASGPVLTPPDYDGAQIDYGRAEA